MQLKSADYGFKHIRQHIVDFFVFLFTLPWLVLVSAWLFCTAITFILNSDAAIRLQQVIPGDFSAQFSFLGVWLLVTLLVFFGALANFVWFRDNRTFHALSIVILMLLLGSYFLVLAPEIDLYLKLRNVV